MWMPLKPFEGLPTFNFMGWRRFWVNASIVLTLGALALLGTHGLNFGIDFVGGKLVQVQTAQVVPVATVRQAIESAGFQSVTIQQYGPKNEFLIRLSGNDPLVQATTAEAKVKEAVGAVSGGVEIRRVEFVGPQVGQELKVKGLLAVLASFVGILIYIWFRFQLRYGLGALLSLMHDVVLTVGLLCLLQTEITLTVLAALLTLIGYSLNDTIVIFDRVRENRSRYPNLPLADVLNQSVNQTLSRTIMTVSTTLLVLIAVLIWGGEVIHDFALVLFVGILLGTYSSIFVASPVLLLLENYYQKLEARRKAEAATL
jgi:preprotein translocase subunit SecF